MMEWKGGLVEWNGMKRWIDRGPVSHVHNSRLKFPMYCKPCKQYSDHPSFGGGGGGGGACIKKEV